MSRRSRRARSGDAVPWLWYSDLPYVFVPSVLAARFRALHKLGFTASPACPSVSHDFDAKWSVFNEYATQVAVLEGLWRLRERLERSASTTGRSSRNAAASTPAAAEPHRSGRSACVLRSCRSANSARPGRRTPRSTPRSTSARSRLLMTLLGHTFRGVPDLSVPVNRSLRHQLAVDHPVVLAVDEATAAVVRRIADDVGIHGPESDQRRRSEARDHQVHDEPLNTRQRHPRLLSGP